MFNKLILCAVIAFTLGSCQVPGSEGNENHAGESVENESNESGESTNNQAKHSNKDAERQSFNFTTASHNIGKNCFECHQPGGQGEKIFNIAGTTFDKSDKASPNGTVKIYTQPQGKGELVYEIPVDGRGNFYTPKSLPSGKQLYPALTGTNGNTKYMSTPLSTGACNSCHGNSQPKIWID